MFVQFVLALFLTAVVSYFLGSCNSAIIVGKVVKHDDIRNYGSKNAGLTNTLRCFGKGCALLTLIGDLSKGVIAVIISRMIFSFLGVGFGDDLDTRFVGYVSGFFAIIGHIFPIYYGFKGGKGVLVSASILLVVDPVTFCIVIPFFALVLFITRYVSVSSISAAIAYPIITYISQNMRSSFTHEQAVLHTILSAGTAVLLIYMHRTNIQRLIAGNENKFSMGGKKDKS